VGAVAGDVEPREERHRVGPYTLTPDEIAGLAAEVRDPNYRVAVAEDGVHIYNPAVALGQGGVGPGGVHDAAGGVVLLDGAAGVVGDPDEIAGLAAEVRDPNYRVAVAEDGVHIYNRAVHATGTCRAG
jgi:hypothetical protein